MTPLVSVIIPTASRPVFLARAIQSALAGTDPGETEIIVVPNGSDESWRQSLSLFDRHPAVRVIPIAERNANQARNTGLDHAQGEWVRFLDDDDYLIPEGARRTHLAMSSTGADIVSGSVRHVDQSDRELALRVQPGTQDLCAAVLGPDRLCLPFAHLIRRATIGKLRWNTRTRVRQDVEWLLELSTHRELHWEKVPDVVGCWVRHQGPRISTSFAQNEKAQALVTMLLHAQGTLVRTRCYDLSKRHALAISLWSLVHTNFFLDPWYWTSIARLAEQQQFGSRPPHAVYSYPVLRNMRPLVLQWLLFPKRWLNYHWRQGKFRSAH